MLRVNDGLSALAHATGKTNPSHRPWALGREPSAHFAIDADRAFRGGARSGTAERVRRSAKSSHLRGALIVPRYRCGRGGDAGALAFLNWAATLAAGAKCLFAKT